MKIKSQKRGTGKTTFIVQQVQWALLFEGRAVVLVPSRDQKTRIERLIREELSEEEFNRCKIITSAGTAQAVMQAILPFDPTNIFIDEYTQMNPDLLSMIDSRFGHMTTATGTPHKQIQPPPYVPLTPQSIASKYNQL